MMLLEANERNSCTWTDIRVHFRDLQRVEVYGLLEVLCLHMSAKVCATLMANSYTVTTFHLHENLAISQQNHYFELG
jgi:hypothetical protein